ncbi:MAG: glycoside hydrolase family 92 protein, partial [Pedobacter sp.]
MFKKTLLAGALLLSTNLYAQEPDLVKYVNTLQGTNSKYELSYGNTYPLVSLPFSMNTWTPHTGVNGEGWKYQYFVDVIRGFQQSHQCSSWVNDYAVYT